MASRKRLTRLVGGAVVAAVATAGTLVALTISAGPALAAGTGVGYLRTSGNKIVDSTGATVRLTGINWFGMETDNLTFHGLWANRTWRSHIDQMAQLGFNTIRVPFTNAALRPGAQATSINTNSNPDLIGLSPLQILDLVINYAGSKGMRIILDRHRPGPGDTPNANPLWYTSVVSEATWISDWQMLAQRYAGNTTVIGADLHNEPNERGQPTNPLGACWGCGVQGRDWRLAAERAGNAILQVQPNWLIFVEGVGCIDGYAPNSNDNIPDEGPTVCDWWGGNLSRVRTHPVRLNVANRLVYSPHDYAISVYDRQPWFEDPTFPANLPGVWDSFWGYIFKENTAPIMLGEFGSTLVNPMDSQWLTSLMAYLGTGINGQSFTYWAWNPNSGDTGGILNGDWMTVDQNKYSKISSYLIAPVPPGSQPPTTTTSQPPQVPGAPGTPTASNVTNNSVTLSWPASTGTVTNYQIERATGATSTTFTQVGTSTTTSFTNNTGLVANTTYRFRVRATNSAGNSPYSPIVNVTTTNTPTQPPGTPGTLSASNVTSSSVSLSWGASTGTVTNYQIERATGATSTTFTQVGTSTTTSFTNNTGLSPNTTYRFRVRATNSAGNSAYSNIVNATTTGTTTTTTTQPPGGCTGAETVTNPWSGAFQGGLTVTNNGTASIPSWTLTLTFAQSVTITQMWGGTFSPASGTTITVRPTYTAPVAPGQTMSFGFLANTSGSTGSTATASCSVP
jgi:endoglucanase